jgi:hypothetical protein
VDGLLLVVNLAMTRRPILEEVKEFLAPLPTLKLGVITVGDQTGHEDRYYYADR